MFGPSFILFSGYATKYLLAWLSNILHCIFLPVQTTVSIRDQYTYHKSLILFCYLLLL